jgi:hypothetical protein
MLPSATKSPLALFFAVGLVGLVGCGDSMSASDGLSAGAGCDAAAAMCAEGCAATCVDGAWQCDCGDATTSTTDASTGPSTGGSGDTASASGDTSSTGDDSTSDASTSTSGTTGDDSTTTAATTTGEATDGVTTGDDSTTGTTGEMTGSTTMDAWEPEQHVHIYIDNFCKVTVDPPEITVPVDETVTLSYHNHSVDYFADVWMSYGGGFLDLELGATWDDQFEWCTGPNQSTGWADISIAGGGNNACPKHRMYIYCE